MAPIAVTGSASGIGAATCRELRDSGHEIIEVDLANADVNADLGTVDGRHTAVDAVLERCAGALDGLVLCAGLGSHVSDARLIAAVNYFGAVALLDGLLPALRKGTRPAAVVVSSVASAQLTWEDNPLASAIEAHDEEAVGKVLDEAGEYRGYVAYAGSKNALTVAVRRRVSEWGGYGIRVNTVAPGSTDTPLLRRDMEDERYGAAVRDFVAPIQRTGQPSEVASMISYLLGPNAGFIHGAQIYLDGGVDALARPTSF